MKNWQERRNRVRFPIPARFHGQPLEAEAVRAGLVIGPRYGRVRVAIPWRELLRLAGTFTPLLNTLPLPFPEEPKA